MSNEAFIRPYFVPEWLNGLSLLNSLLDLVLYAIQIHLSEPFVCWATLARDKDVPKGKRGCCRD